MTSRPRDFRLRKTLSLQVIQSWLDLLKLTGESLVNVLGVGGDKIAGLLETGNGNIAASILTSIKALQTELQNTGANIGTDMEGAGIGNRYQSWSKYCQQ